MNFLFLTSWLIAGLVASIPYMILSSGTIQNMFTFAWVAPLGAFWLYTLWQMRKLDNRMTTFLWLVVSYTMLPIFMNGGSFYFAEAGFPRVSHVLFTLRFAIMLIIPLVAMVVGYMIAQIMETMYTWRRSHATGTPGAPPSTPNDPTGSGGEEIPSGGWRGDDPPHRLRVAVAHN